LILLLYCIIFLLLKIIKMENGQKYFIARIQIDFEDEETGKIKKKREEKLVMGYNPTDVEAKVTKIFQHYTQEWRITSISESKIDEVIE
jgi:hypothetical protein